MGLTEQVYGTLWRVARPLLKRNKRLAHGFAERLVPDGWAPKKQPGELVVWVQAASGGESWLVHSLGDALAGCWPQAAHLAIVATSCTLQGMEVLRRYQVPEGQRSNVRFTTRYFPLDEPGVMQRAIETLCPDLIILLETELWPGLLLGAKRAGVPVLVANGRMTEKSFRGYQWLPGLFAQAAPKEILAITPEDASRFQATFPAAQVATMSNIKFDRVWEGLVQEKTVQLQAETASWGNAGRAVLAFASVRQQEEPIIFPLLEALLNRQWAGETPLLVVAPRHMERTATWKEELQNLGIQAAFRSTHESLSGAQVLVWDTFGELDQLYAHADVAFVGGSLAPLGGQNFLESLASGAVTVVGPYCDNFRWAQEGLVDLGLLRVISGPAELEKTLWSTIEQSYRPVTQGQEVQGARVQRRQAFASWVDKRRGGSQRVAEVVARLLLRKQE